MIILTLFVWIVAALGFHIHRDWYYKNRPYEYSRRHEGLVAFSDRQWWWIMTLWPLAVLALIFYAVLLLVAALIEWLLNRNDS